MKFKLLTDGGTRTPTRKGKFYHIYLYPQITIKNMVKKNSGKVVQMLSPENYIRTKARTLPLFECWINTDWEEVNLASCIVSRKHSNGNITYCFYLVDLLCQGVKNTHFVFNGTLSQYKDFLAQTEEDISLELVDYVLVHNVIHAGIEYADEYEFKPCKDFTSTTQYFLEKDNDDIELMEIECGGDDGLPVYLYSSSTTTAKELNRIIAHLKRTAGPDNYTLVDEDDMGEEDDDFDDDFDDEEDIYTQNTFEENREIFINLFSGLGDSDDPNDLYRLTKVTNALFIEITDNALVDQYYDELFDRLSIDVESEEIIKEFPGINSEIQLYDELNQLFMSIFGNIQRNLKKAHTGLEMLRREAGEIPAFAFLKLVILQKEGSDKFPETLQKYALAYPDYSLITLLRLIHIYSSKDVPEEIANKTFNLDTLFPGRNSLHYLEMFYYLMFISNLVTYEENANKMEAFYLVLDEFDLPEEISEIVEDLFSFARVGYLADYFDIEIKP